MLSVCRLLILGQVRCLSLLWLPCESHFNDYMHMYARPSVRSSPRLAVYKCKAMQSWNLNRNRFSFLQRFFSSLSSRIFLLSLFYYFFFRFVGFCICNFGPLGSQFQHPRYPIRSGCCGFLNGATGPELIFANNTIKWKLVLHRNRTHGELQQDHQIKAAIYIDIWLLYGI